MTTTEDGFEAVINGFNSTLARDLINRAKGRARSSDDFEVFLAIARDAQRHINTRRERLQARMAPVTAMRDKLVKCDGCQRKHFAYKMKIKKDIVSCYRCREALLGCRNPEAVSITILNFEKICYDMQVIGAPWEPNNKFITDYSCAVIFEEYRKAKVVADTWPFNACDEAAIFRSTILSGRAQDHYCSMYNDIKERMEGCCLQIKAWNEAYKAMVEAKDKKAA